jgi:alpha-L-fucosidase
MPVERFDPTWSSLKKHQSPEWLMDAKFGIYYHWGIYSVPARGSNGSWYPYNMYRKGTPQNKYHVKKYGDPAKFGYKDFIPQFTAEKFNPDAWAKLFKEAGAKFAGPVAEHHDGFSMWDSKVNPWNAKQMGPKRDTVGEMAQAIRKQGMKFLAAFHHAENWWFYQHWSREYDTADPRYAGLYGPLHDQDADSKHAKSLHDWNNQANPTVAFWETWKAKIVEVIDKYRPDLLWFDFGLGRVHDRYKREVLAYYFNRALEWDVEVDVMYKTRDLPPNIGLLDYELGRSDKLTYHRWITDTSIDDQGAWGYVQEAGVKSLSAVVHNLIDNVSKNGLLLLNVGPKPNGEIPTEACQVLQGLGDWLTRNGEAIYQTTPWIMAEEGPTKLSRSGMFSERVEVNYTPQDIRFVTKGNAIYAIVLGCPAGTVTIRSLIPSVAHLERKARPSQFYSLTPEQIAGITMLGHPGLLQWEMAPQGLRIHLPTSQNDPKDQAAVVFKIDLQ